MKRKIWSAVLAVCMTASVILQSMTACKEIVYADDVSGEIKASSISLGTGVSSVITTDGSFCMWGYYRYGHAGRSMSSGTELPVGSLKIMDHVKQASIGGGFGDSYYGVVKTDGKLYMWGQEDNGDGTNHGMPVEILNDVVSVDLDYGRAGAITADGSLYIWSDINGAIRLGSNDKIKEKLMKVMDNAVSVSIGAIYSAVLTSDGSLYMWKNDEDMRPEKIMDNVESFSLGGVGVAVIKKDGSLCVWNSIQFASEVRPDLVMSDMAQVEVDNCGTISAVARDGSLYMWGCNDFGQVGNGTKIDCPEPVKILDHVVSVGLGRDHSGAITADGSLYMWGCNENGQLGDDSNEDSLVPKKINLKNTPISMYIGEPEDSDKLYRKKSGIYMIDKESDGQCIYYAPISSDITTAAIPAAVTLNGRKYKVTSIYSSAFKNCTKLENVNIGKNMTQIGENAFSGCKNLKTITIQSDHIKIAGKDCFRGISKKAVIKVPKAKQAAYKKLFRNKGQGADVKIKGLS